MACAFIPPDLDKWQDLHAENALEGMLITFFADERPLRGAGALCDFRLCGRLSKLIRRGKLDGHRGETLLLPAAKKLPFRQLVLYGLGPSSEFSERVASEAARGLAKLADGLNLKRYAVVLPGRSLEVFPLRRVLGLFLASAGRQAEIAVIERPEMQKEAADLLGAP